MTATMQQPEPLSRTREGSRKGALTMVVVTLVATTAWSDEGQCGGILTGVGNVGNGGQRLRKLHDVDRNGKLGKRRTWIAMGNQGRGGIDGERLEHGVTTDGHRWLQVATSVPPSRDTTTVSAIAAIRQDANNLVLSSTTRPTSALLFFLRQIEGGTDQTMERSKWKKVAYGGMQPGYDDNYTDESFLEEMVMNANVVKRDMPKVMLDSVSITQYVCIVSLVVSVWAHTLSLHIDEDIALLALGFSVLLLTARQLSIQLLSHYLLNISFFISGLYVLAPIYYTLTRSIRSDSIVALTVSLLIIHLFLHDYSGSTIRPPGALKNPNLAS
ncbi:hypothetical protein ZIOFF_028835 [Zingiber officinale]|uniref:Uncharacterized protein n=1 Tax=Zingiber officinale TaxID=94328 RepID=A0A8J5GLU4_ZINOF|nr:hypothetical protein ZIOFF_028835 [Zingiber officinale]